MEKRKIKKTPFAAFLQEYPQTLNEITKGRRGITAALSLKINKALGFEEGTMLILQANYEIQKETIKLDADNKPNLTLIRKQCLWIQTSTSYTGINNINHH